MKKEQHCAIHPHEVSFVWASLKRETAREMVAVQERGRARFVRLGLGAASVATGVVLGVILYPAVQSEINDIIAKDNNVFRQTSQTYR